MSLWDQLLAIFSIEDGNIAGNVCVPAGRTAMVNMLSITHDPNIWEFHPQRFVVSKGKGDVYVMGNDLRPDTLLDYYHFCF